MQFKHENYAVLLEKSTRQYVFGDAEPEVSAEMPGWKKDEKDSGVQSRSLTKPSKPKNKGKYECVLTQSSSLFLQYFDTVGWVFWPVKTVSRITYTVLVGT